MFKKVVVFGGGTGMSVLLKGLKDFPVDITAVITVSDNGRSTGKLRKEFNIPAVGDIRKVITNLSLIDEDIKDLMSYRFETSSDLNGHAVGNLMLTALMDITGSLKSSIKSLSKLLDVRHTILPISEDPDLTLVAEDSQGHKVEGEAEITDSTLNIDKIYYKNKPNVSKDVINAIHNADLVIFSMGSLYTSILPNIICDEVLDAIDKSNVDLLYTCNAVTQPGETDEFSVSKHVNLINSYLKNNKLDVVIASNTKINEDIAKKYETQEQKNPVLIDYDEIKKENIELIEDDLIIVEDNQLRHDSLKLGYLIFSYLMRK